jgi:O-antigen ligase/tetratricopeptide (TPR) repeat protein
MPWEGDLVMRMEEARLVWDEHGERFDRAIEWLLTGLLVFTPLAFGAVEAWSEEIVIVLAASMSICFLLKVIAVKGTAVAWTWAYVPIAVFILVAAAQLAPMPPKWIALLSPNTVARKTELLSDLSNSGELLSTMTISFYPYATRHDLRLVLAVAAVFAVVINVYRRSDRIARLLGTIAAVGAGVALVALAQNIGGNGKIYWFVPTPGGNAHSGPFVNHSHFAQFMNLSIGAGLGLALVKLHRQFRGQVTLAVVLDYLCSAKARVVWALLAMSIVGAASVFASLSRAGIISLLIAGALTTLALSSKRALRGSGWIMVLLALGAFICVLYIGFDAVYDRLGTLKNPIQQEGGRWQIVKDVAVAWTRFPIVGTGLGTHEVVYPEFDRSTVPELPAHAENEYAQTAEETGILGIVPLVVFGILVWVYYVRNIRAGHVPIRSAAYGIGFGLVAIMVHSLTDFGQHVPANAFLTAIFCALLFNIWHTTASAEAVIPQSLSTPKGQLWFGILGLMALCTLWAYVLLGSDAARRGEARWKRAVAAESYLEKKNWQGSDEEYIELIAAAQKAAAYQPRNVKYAHWLNLYRWRAISRVTDPSTGEVVLLPKGQEFAERIVDELRQAVVLCPTYGPTWCVLGQLEKFVLGRELEGARHVRRSRRLAPCDTTVCLVTGMLDAAERDADGAFYNWSRAVQLDHRVYKEAALMCIRLLDRPDMALKLADDKISRLRQLASILTDSDQDSDLTDEVSVRLLELLEAKRQQPGDQNWTLAPLAEFYRRAGRVDDAIDAYRRALAIDYSRTDLRISLARLLAEKGLRADAIRELKICLRLRPEFRAAHLLLEELSAQVSAGRPRHR